MSLAALKNNDIRLFLDTLQEVPSVSTHKSCRLLVVNTLAGKLYLPSLDAKYEAYKLVPSVASEGDAPLPLTHEMAEADQHHDGVIWSTRSFCEAILADPMCPAGPKAAAQRILDSLAPASTTASYVDQAGKYPHYREMAESLSDDLTLFSLSWQGPGRTLKDAILSLAETTEKMADLLHERAHLAGMAPDQSANRAIRGETLRILSQFRAALATEIAQDPSLPRDLETQVFGFLDTMAKHRAAQGMKSDAKAKAPEESG